MYDDAAPPADAEARCDDALRAAEVDDLELADTGAHAFSKLDRGLLGRCIERDAELFAAEPEQDVTRAMELCLDRASNRAQGGVARLMSIAIVVRLEVIYIEHAEG